MTDTPKPPPSRSDVATLIARYRAADAAAATDDPDHIPGSTDPTRVWSVAEFRAVLDAAEIACGAKP